MGGSSLSQRKSIVRRSLKRGSYPALHGHDPEAEGPKASFIGRRRFLATLSGSAVVWPLPTGLRAHRRLIGRTPMANEAALRNPTAACGYVDQNAAFESLQDELRGKRNENSDRRGDRCDRPAVG